MIPPGAPLVGLALSLFAALFAPAPEPSASGSPTPTADAPNVNRREVQPIAAAQMRQTAADVWPPANKVELLPIDLSAFGDIFYAHESSAPDAFHVGSLEVDIALKLVPYVTAFGGIAYDARNDAMRLASFTVDGGLWGKDEHAFLRSRLIDASGLIIGKFDVPFGVAYLQYGAPDNHLVTLASPVLATHGVWNEIGAQFYASTTHTNLVGYVVNGAALKAKEDADPRRVIGGRLGLKPLGEWANGRSFELGGSLTGSPGPPGASVLMWGADLSAAAAGAELKHELIELSRDGQRVRGFYSQCVYKLDPVFFGARYGTAFDAEALQERTLTFSTGVELIPKGEVRLMYQRDLEGGGTLALLQLVAGSKWQPTGLRR